MTQPERTAVSSEGGKTKIKVRSKTEEQNRFHIFDKNQCSLCIDSVKHIQIRVNYGSTPPLPLITKLRKLVSECSGER